MSVGYFSKNSLNLRISHGSKGHAFTLWETVDGRIVPVTLVHEQHNQFQSSKMEEVGELKTKIQKLDIPSAVNLFGTTAEDIVTALDSLKDIKEAKEVLALLPQ